MFDPAVWGTVGQWFSGSLTGGSLLLGFYIVLRDRGETRRAQAKLISFVLIPQLSIPDEDGTHTYGTGLDGKRTARVSLHNASDMSIIAPRLVADPVSRWRARRAENRAMTDGELRSKIRLYQAKRTAADQTFYTVRRFFGLLSQVKMYELSSSDPESELIEAIDGPDEIPGHERTSLTVDYYLPNWYYDFELRFTDANNIQWCRDLSTGRLKERTYRKGQV